MIAFKERKLEHGMRTDLVPKIFETLKKLRDDLPSILESKPWITEDESKDAYDRLDEVTKWLEEQSAAQNKRSLTEDPLFKSEDIEKKLKKATDTYKKVTNKKKPKEKKPKGEKKEETTEEEVTEDNEREQQDL